MKADQIIKSYYKHYNAGEFDKALEYMADDVEYHDMIYDKPFKGKETMREYLIHVKGQIPGLQFVVDETTQDDPYRVGVIWHVELDGKPFPFSNGSSFYKVNQKGQMIYGRDIAEPSLKTGASIFPFLKLISGIIKTFNITPKPTAINFSAIILWVVYAAYMYHILFDPDAPGKNVNQMGYDDLKPTIDLSTNIYFLGDVLKKVGIEPIPVHHYNAVWESLFNGVLVWAFSFLPFILADEKSRRMNKIVWWGLGWFITNIAYFPFFAIRASQKTELFDFQLSERSKKLPRWSPILGIASLAGMGFFIWYGFNGGDQTPQQRSQYFIQSFWNDRIFYAFNWDMVLMYVWQFLIVEAPIYVQAVPFFGPAIWMIVGPKR